MIRSIIILFLTIIISSFATMTQKEEQTVVLITTSAGKVKIKLYNETYRHKENFIKLVDSGFYEGLLFHRVIKDFMIQGGDPNSKNAPSGMQLGNGGPGYTIPAEIQLQYFHKKGAIAAARLPDSVNPDKESSGSQFYIVQGKVFTPEQLQMMVDRYMHPKFTEAQIEAYTSIGGTPHLDYQYTVFGEVIEGMDIIDKIADVPVDQNNRPLSDILIYKAEVLK